ncbi:hypothetical protein B0H12DRAFT_1091569, partial [Mycena haematopus]
SLYLLSPQAQSVRGHGMTTRTRRTRAAGVSRTANVLKLLFLPFLSILPIHPSAPITVLSCLGPPIAFWTFDNTQRLYTLTKPSVFPIYPIRFDSSSYVLHDLARQLFCQLCKSTTTSAGQMNSIQILDRSRPPLRFETTVSICVSPSQCLTSTISPISLAFALN